MIEEMQKMLRKMEEDDRAPLGPVVLPEWLYDRAVAQGISTEGYVRRQPIPETGGSIWR